MEHGQELHQGAAHHHCGDREVRLGALQQSIAARGVRKLAGLTQSVRSARAFSVPPHPHPGAAARMTSTTRYAPQPCALCSGRLLAGAACTQRTRGGSSWRECRPGAYTSATTGKLARLQPPAPGVPPSKPPTPTTPRRSWTWRAAWTPTAPAPWACSPSPTPSVRALRLRTLAQQRCVCERSCACVEPPHQSLTAP